MRLLHYKINNNENGLRTIVTKGEQLFDINEFNGMIKLTINFYNAQGEIIYSNIKEYVGFIAK